MRTEFVEKLAQASSQNEGVIIAYTSGIDPNPHDFLLFPQQMFQKNGFSYVEGWSVHHPRRIKLFRGDHDSGKIRVFRVDKILNVADRETKPIFPTCYLNNKIRRRKVVPGFWELLLDLLILMFLVGIASGVLRLIFGD